MIELKPCPFCGGDAYLFVDDGVRVLCDDCGATSITRVDVMGARGPSGNAVEAVIKAWNHRAGEEEPHHARETL